MKQYTYLWVTQENLGYDGSWIDLTAPEPYKEACASFDFYEYYSPRFQHRLKRVRVSKELDEQKESSHGTT